MIRQVMISASILASDFNCLGEEVRRVTEAGADFIHIDVMDGHFVPNITIGSSVVKALRKSSQLPFDVHLMIENPENYVDSFIKAGADLITVHQEATKHLQKIVRTIKEQGVKAGVAINPATPLVTLEEILTDSDLVLIMSVNPGFAGQDFIPSSINKIKRLRRWIDDKFKNVIIEVDGGISPENSHLVKEAGADILVSGSAIFQNWPYDLTISALKAL